MNAGPSRAFIRPLDPRDGNEFAEVGEVVSIDLRTNRVAEVNVPLPTGPIERSGTLDVKLMPESVPLLAMFGMLKRNQG